MRPMMLHFDDLRFVFFRKISGETPVRVSGVQVHGYRPGFASDEFHLPADRFFQVFRDADLLPVAYVLGGPDPSVRCNCTCQVLLRSQRHRISRVGDGNVVRHVSSGPPDELRAIPEHTEDGVVCSVHDLLIVEEPSIGLYAECIRIRNGHGLSGRVGGGHHERIRLHAREQDVMHPGVWQEHAHVVQSGGDVLHDIHGFFAAEDYRSPRRQHGRLLLLRGIGVPSDRFHVPSHDRERLLRTAVPSSELFNAIQAAADMGSSPAF